MYYEEFFELLTECEQSCNELQLRMQSVHPYELINDKDSVINEAIINRNSINKTIMTLVAKFQEIVRKARIIAKKLLEKNKSWFESADNFFKNNHDTKIEEYEVYDYPVGIQRMQSIGIPKFESIELGHFENDGKIFKEKAFKDIYSIEAIKDENGNEITSEDAKAKAYFRGGSEKKKLNSSQIMSFAKNGYSWLKDYDRFIENIAKTSEGINSVMKKIFNINSQAPITESTILHESLFRDEYFDILLEDAVDPSDIEKEEKEGNNSTPINSNTEENKSSDENKTRMEAAKVWYKTCTVILTAKLDICEEAYKAYTDLIDKMMDNSGSKKNTSSGNNTTDNSTVENSNDNNLNESATFMEKHGIKKVGGSIGFSEKEQKWYGWSHRAIFGFKVGDKCKKDQLGVGDNYTFKAGDTLKTLDDCKKRAEDFSKSVS